MCGVAGADEEGEAHRPQPSGKVPEKSDCHAADKAARVAEVQEQLSVPAEHLPIEETWQALNWTITIN